MICQRRVHSLLITYTILPHRNQDVVFISSDSINPFISVVDAWTNPKFIKGDVLGRKSAFYVAHTYPRDIRKESHLLQKNALVLETKKFDNKFLQRYPHHTASVGAFLFPLKENNIVVLGSVDVFYWDKNKWNRPKEQGDYTLPYPKYPSDCSRFFGRGDLKKSSPIYSCEPDIIHILNEKPLFIATDGLLKAMPIDVFQRYSRSHAEMIRSNPKMFMKKLQEKIKQNFKQIDDITLLLVAINKNTKQTD